MIEPITMASHVFVAMPFGRKKGFDGNDIDFDAVYRDFIKPALVDAGFEVFRADEETRAGDILPDMFQELLIADLVVVDLSVDNPNVWYELGVRHALRTRGVVLVQSTRPYQPFDVYSNRKLTYHLAAGVPDPSHVEQDKAALVRMALDTVNSWYGNRASPVYQHLPHLTPPRADWLFVDAANQFKAAHEAWSQRLAVARKAGRIGDIMLLAEEGPARMLRLDGHRRAGAELRASGALSFALEQYEKALAIEPNDVESQRQKGLLLGKLGRRDEAKELLRALAWQQKGSDAETLAYLGRLGKDEWVALWRRPGESPSSMRAEAAAEDAVLREAFDWYARGFAADPSSYFAGTNALTLMTLHEHLTGMAPEGWDAGALAGAVRWAALASLRANEVDGKKDYWARVTLADVAVLTDDATAVERRYREAIAVAEKDWFALNSSREQLLLLRDLEFRPDVVARAAALFERALTRLEAPRTWSPKRVLLFSGHMIDAAARPTPRFPHDKRDVARAAIDAVLDELQAGPDDLGLCGGACGGDILFAESMLARQARVELRLVFQEPEFLRNSVTFEKASPPTDDWRDRYYRIKQSPNTTTLVLPDELGATPSTVNPYERCNVWQIYSALARGPERVHAILLWNGQSGDGRGGTRHMHDEINRRTGQVHVLRTTALW